MEDNPVVHKKAIFPYEENVHLLDALAIKYPIYAFPEDNIVLFDGQSSDLLTVSCVLSGQVTG